MFNLFKNKKYEKAKELAQREIQYFIEFLSSHPYEENGLFVYSVKSKFSEDDIVEHMWSQVFKYEDGYFIGKLANQPYNLSNIKLDDEVKIKREDVEDFVLVDYLINARTGGFSL